MAFITLDRSAFYHNLDRIAERAGAKEKVALVLKDNAYGHGLVPMARAASAYGIEKAVVRTADEAQAIAPYFSYILVLSDIPEAPMPDTCFAVNALQSIDRFPKGSRVELKVDTGMHRNGIAPDELAAAFEAITRRGLVLEAVFSHHRSADEAGSAFFWQRKRFEAVKQEAAELARRYGLAPLRFHMANSAALFRTHRCDEDMVRVGIAAYGCLQMDETLAQPDLRPVLALWGERVCARELKAGERVGYGGTFEAPVPTEAGVYDVGYADGLLRSASGRGYETPGGAALLGRVSMDSCMFDTQDAALCIFDDARRYAEAAGTIAYEVLVGLSPAIARRMV